jgi:hypothetical protein
MIQFIKNLFSQISSLFPFSAMDRSLVLVRVTEKFDVVERVSGHTSIK